jgi:uncharacterized protein YkwD
MILFPLPSFRVITMLASLMLLSGLALGADPKPEFKLTELEQQIVDATNAERKAKNLPELKPNPKLMAAARAHAENMAQQNKMEHELDGKKPHGRVKAEGYSYRTCGENIAYRAETAKEVLKGWMDSPGHKANILKDSYAEIGVAAAKNKKGELYWVQVFGTQLK